MSIRADVAFPSAQGEVVAGNLGHPELRPQPDWDEYGAIMGITMYAKTARDIPWNTAGVRVHACIPERYSQLPLPPAVACILEAHGQGLQPCAAPHHSLQRRAQLCG